LFPHQLQDPELPLSCTPQFQLISDTEEHTLPAKIQQGEKGAGFSYPGKECKAGRLQTLESFPNFLMKSHKYGIVLLN
jgi:hypothetical protein